MVPFLPGLLLCGLAALPAPPPAQEAPPTRDSRPALEVQKRLASLPEPQRERLERHLEEFERLSPAARRKLLERARALQERERALERAGPGGEAEAPAAPVRPAPAGEPRAERHERLREQFRAEGRELRQRLPDGLRRRLEKAEPEQRRRLLERLSQERDRFSRRAIGEMKTRQRLSAREAQRLERLPLEERVRALRELAGPRHARERGRRGPPSEPPREGG